MSSKWKRPGDALARSTGAEKENQLASTSFTQTYATSRELQTRYLRRRCGLDEHTAHLIAMLHFGEGR
ncbi:hypothetical protein [Roseovarius aestuariivivens]|uniref:hypothetical protein n=1 Tax=Roseovarius aestuariivivens TaxID=1888910 RepID=UPI00108143A6|nr:hypothetical protein [Roseovarius aestuariivivens]